MTPTVSIWKSQYRKTSTQKALQLIQNKQKLSDRLKKAKNIVIKPNCLSASVQKATTHKDLIETVIKFIRKFNNNPITLAEGSAENTFKAFKRFGYYDLEKYDTKFVDNNKDDYKIFAIYNRDLKKNIRIKVSQTMLESDFLVSLANMKVHDCVVVTLSLKNSIMGSIVGADKTLVHQSIKAINKSLALLARSLWPDLALVDGFSAMEGRGPLHGQTFNKRIILASSDPLALDITTTKIMGVSYQKIGYLYYLAKNKPSSTKPEVIGNTEIKKEIHPFKLHENIEEQWQWH